MHAGYLRLILGRHRGRGQRVRACLRAGGGVS